MPARHARIRRVRTTPRGPRRATLLALGVLVLALVAPAALSVTERAAAAVPTHPPTSTPSSWTLPPGPATLPLPSTPALPAALDAAQPYRPQRFCDPVAKTGTLALQALLRRTYPQVRSQGITRACHLGARSEHKEGRALDWAADVRVPAQAQAAGRFLRWLTALDAAGTPATARRMGVMYLIYDRHTWSVTDPRWRPYTGADPHLDHVHISLTWAGARGLTSFWSGRPAPAVEAPPIPIVELDATRLPRTPVTMGAVGPAVEVLRVLLRVDPAPRPGAPRTAADPHRDPLRAPAFDQRSFNELRALQLRAGLPVTGVADRRSFARARLEFHTPRPPASAAPRPAAPAPSPARTPSPAPLAPRPAAPSSAPPSSAQPTPVLRQGDRGAPVAELQDLLSMRPPAGSRGVFGSHTHARVVEFQRRVKLTPDGVVGPRTWAALRSR